MQLYAKRIMVEFILTILLSGAVLTLLDVYMLCGPVVFCLHFYIFD